ncbi:uncharacterized protein LOC120479027 [Pimephales promelas]|uniref:uncharacterized protein LOC120479027 n=1 Tax=Pimephales promelas TaxID=90988 RepID=UPI001955A344|nr:uncharacterized protein LOC120479027 [Pimephales promelas]
MRVLIILFIVICQTSLVLSEYVYIITKCNAENDEHLENCSATDQRIWKTSLANCSSLQLECTDIKHKRCYSFEECGLANETEIVKNLDGSIDCEFSNKFIDCSIKLSCEHKRFVCNEPYCELKHTVPHNKYCKFSHSFRKCIKENEKFPVKGDITCTDTYNRTELETRLSDECPSKLDCPGYLHATIGLGIALCLVVLGGPVVAYRLMKRCRNGRGAAADNRLDDPQANAVPMLQFQDAAADNRLDDPQAYAVPMLQFQDAAADSRLDDPQAMPMLQFQDAEADNRLDDPLRSSVSLEELEELEESRSTTY